MNIFLLRHGETDWNQAGRLQGHMDIPLNQNGRLQISHAAQILADLYPDIDLVISSPLSRARESAEIVSDRLAYERTDIIVEPLLVERCFGEGEGLTIAERKEKYPDDIYPGLESLNDLLKRARSVFERIVLSFADKENILVAAHGAILYAMVTAITDGQIAYGGEKVKFEPGSLHLIRYINGTIEVAEYSKEKSAFDVLPLKWRFPCSSGSSMVNL